VGSLPTSDVGTYPISISGGVNSNYIISHTNGLLTVNKAALTVTGVNKTRVYGTVNPELTVSYAGFKNNDDETDIDTPPSVMTDALTGSDAGSYDILVSGASDNNYSFIYVKGTLTISKADQSITFEPIPQGLRISQQYELVANASSGLPVTFVLSDPRFGNLFGNILTIEKDGDLTITASQPGNINLNPAESVTRSVKTLPTFDNVMSLFTPNNDGMNDYWYIPDLESYGQLKVTVYNRFGQSIYKSDSYIGDWDGTWNGNPLPSGSYYYIMTSSKKGTIKGVVNIVR
jgi:gliding motility-associated-like protein